jgi:hypothetical protein
MLACMTMMRFAAVSVLLLVTCVRDSLAQPPSTQAPIRVTRHATKPRDPNCDPHKTMSDAHEPVVSAPPSTVPAISDTPAPGAVTIPIPTLPDPSPAPGCADSSADFPSERMRKFQHEHPEAVRTMMRINTTLPGWTLRADTIIDGSAIAGGIAYRHGLDEDRASFDMMGMLSIRTYYLVTAGISYARAKDRRLLFHAALRHESFPQEAFYGFGRDTSGNEHTVYWRQAFDSVGGVTFSPASSLHITGTAGVLNVRMLSGRDGDKPSTEDRFSPADVSGLTPGVWRSYVHAGAGIDVDRTDDVMFPKGGRYRGSFTRYRGLGDGNGLFSRVDIDVRQYWPVPYTANQVLAARVLLGSVSSQDAAAVPFYFLPRLGGGTTLRSYDTSRLTDHDALAVNVEYRVRLNRLQLLGLVDLGDVAPTFGSLRPSKFHTATGAGVRFQAGGTFLPGVDIAHGSEGWAAIVRLGHAF